MSCHDVAEWLSRAIAVNCRIAHHCKGNGWTFIDNWDLFYDKNTLYARDRVHLSRQGVRVMSGTLERELNVLQRFFVSQEMVKTCGKDREYRIAKCRTVTSKTKIGNSLNVYCTNCRSI